MKVKDVYDVADRIAPKALSDEMCERYGWYDNSGILVDVDEEVTGIVCSLDLCAGAIYQALDKGANLILTHHPAIFGKISRIDYNDEGLLGKKLIGCIRNGISVVAMHLNLDAAPHGIDECLMQGITDSAAGKTGAGTRLLATQLQLSGGGYGRAYEVEEISLSALADNMKKTFQSARVKAYGEENKKVKRVASFCGSGADEKAVSFAVRQGVDVLVSSDIKHHVLLLALEAGLSVITLTHYASENYGYKKYYEKISRAIALPCSYYEETDLL